MSLPTSNNTTPTMSLGSSNVTTNNATAEARAQTNATSTEASAASSKYDGSVMSLLTFGPLTSCLTMPNLSAAPVPPTSNLSTAAQQEKVQAWLAQLPTSSSCTSLAWKLRPDYSEQLSAVADFQAQLQQLFPPNNATLAGGKGLVEQPVGAGGFATNTSSTTNISPSAAAMSSTALDANGSFVGSSAGSSTLPGFDSSGTSPPTGLPLWIGVVLASTALVHLVALLVHFCADLDALCPSLAANLNRKQTESVLPRHAVSVNASSATLVESKSTHEIETDAKTVDPPGYAEPVEPQVATAASQSPNRNGSGESVEPIAALVRISRKAKRLVVPLLLVSALGTIAVAVVLNAKFAPGPVGQLATLTTQMPIVSGNWADSTSVPSPTGGTVTNSVASGSATDGQDSNLGAATSTSTKPATAPAATAKPSNTSLGEKSRSPSMLVDPSSESANAPATPTMARIKRRQPDLFPPVSRSTDAAATPEAAQTNAAGSSGTNALLFPPTPTLATPSPTAPPSAPTLSATTGSTSVDTTPTDAPSPFVVVRGASMHRLWWIVMLDLLLWFAQRRRTRSQTLLDKARTTLLAQFQHTAPPSVVQQPPSQ